MINKFSLLSIKENLIILSLILAALLLRLIFISPWLEDWDSVQFALAMRYFSIVDQQPHPPGYLFYILLAKAVDIFIKNEHLSLTLLSIISSSLMVIPFYLLTLNLTNRIFAIFSTVLLTFTPVSWALSEVALTNIPGMAFLITSTYLLYIGRNNRKYLLFGSLLSGLTTGVRFAEYSIIIPLLALLIIDRKGRDALLVVLLFIIGVSVWLIPTIIYTGTDQFIDSYSKQVSYITNHDSVLSNNSTLKLRILRLKQLFIWGYSPFFIALIIIAFTKILLTLKSRMKFEFIFILIWLFSYLIPLVFLYNLEVTRYTLPLLPPLILLIAYLFNKAKSGILIFLFALFTISTAIEGYKQAQSLHTLLPPVISSVNYIRTNFNPDDTVLVTSFTYRQFQYYAPKFENFYNTGLNNSDKKYVVIDYIGLKNNLPLLSKYTLIDYLHFEQPEVIFPRIFKTDLYVFEKTNKEI